MIISPYVNRSDEIKPITPEGQRAFAKCNSFSVIFLHKTYKQV